MTRRQGPVRRRALLVLAAATLVSCAGSSDSFSLACDRHTGIQGGIPEDAVGSATAVDEARHALSTMAPNRSYSELVPTNERDTVWAALDDEGDVVALVTVIEMNSSFVASSLSYCDK